MLNVTISLYVIAFILTLINGITGKVPLWIAVLLLTIGLMMGGFGR